MGTQSQYRRPRELAKRGAISFDQWMELERDRQQGNRAARRAAAKQLKRYRRFLTLVRDTINQAHAPAKGQQEGMIGFLQKVLRRRVAS